MSYLYLKIVKSYTIDSFHIFATLISFLLSINFFWKILKSLFPKFLNHISFQFCLLCSEIKYSLSQWLLSVMISHFQGLILENLLYNQPNFSLIALGDNWSMNSTSTLFLSKKKLSNFYLLKFEFILKIPFKAL